MFVCTQPPIERVLGSAFINRGGRYTEVQDKCYDVPLLSTLQQLLKTETVSKEVDEHVQGSPHDLDVRPSYSTLCNPQQL